MKEFMEYLESEMRAAFEAAGYDSEFAKVNVSGRPDLCEYQCNGAMPLAKKHGKAPIEIAKSVVEKLEGSFVIENADAVMPGFINFNITPAFAAEYMRKMASDERLSIPEEEKDTIVIDYGGPNVAKPLHIGHLRSAVIGESIKRMGRALGHNVIGDVHLGDWGLQMGLLIAALEEKDPTLPYFDESFEGEYPAEPIFTISELEEMYPAASAKSKEDEAFKEKAMNATAMLQDGRRGYRKLWEDIMAVSIADLKKNYKALDVDFDLWMGESDVQPIIPGMIEEMKSSGVAKEDDGALIIDVAKSDDSKEIPPCIIQKSDGASLYATTDLATLIWRTKELDIDRAIYVVDKRQDMHFLQVFRASRLAGIVKEDTKLDFLGFGTMNGKDGKPFKTRDGGVMRLEYLIGDIVSEMEKKIKDNKNVKEEDAKETAQIVGLAALKYGDLSNQATKDYIFDIDKFTSFEGNTGPYILYTIVRIKSILEKYENEFGKEKLGAITPELIIAPSGAEEKELMRGLAGFGTVCKNAFDELAPHRLCQYLYELSNSFNRFYHATKILSESDEAKQNSYIALLELAKSVMEKGIDLLGFSAPDKM